MKKYATIVIFFAVGILLLFASAKISFASADPAAGDGLTGGSFTPPSTAAPSDPTAATSVPDNVWIPDADVTFAGKSVARARNFLDWNLKNYTWSTVNDTSLSDYWVKIRNIVYALLLIVVFGASVVMIVSHGTSLTVWGFIRKFIIIVVLITFSFALIRLCYQLTDIIQGFFIKNPDNAIISVKDLLNISFNYADFAGFRLSGTQNDEAAFIATNLTKLTAITYYVMACILLVRKIILWFFIVVSPIFPLLILYMPLRNTAKIWVGEFFRWLFYAPLFMIFLSGLVSLWRSKISVLNFQFNAPKQPLYPTAINILLGGPGQTVSQTNNLNYDDTFILYVVSLIMLWAVIFLPFLLLRIFLNYIANISVDDDKLSYIKNSIGRLTLNPNTFGNNSFITKPVGTEKVSVRPEGIIKSSSTTNRGDSFINRVNSGTPTSAQSTGFSSSQQTTPKVSVSVHTTSDATRDTASAYDIGKRSIPSSSSRPSSETALRTHTAGVSTEALSKTLDQALKGISNNSQQPLMPGQFPRPMTIKANVTAKSDDSSGDYSPAAGFSHGPNVKAPGIDQKTQEQDKDKKDKGEASAQTDEAQKAHPNDYTEFKNTWIKNFRSENPPEGNERKDWIESEKEIANNIVRLLMTGKEEDIASAKEKVSHTMPFLLLDGFSRTKAVGYLEAKIEAAEFVLHELNKK